MKAFEPMDVTPVGRLVRASDVQWEKVSWLMDVKPSGRLVRASEVQ